VRLIAQLRLRATQPELLEVVLVDSGCTDGTVAAARAEARSLPFPLTVCAAAAKGRGAALDTGSESAQGGIIFVCHADCVGAPPLLSPPPLCVLWPGREGGRWVIFRNGAR
jgi:glycosyltransferase involved in cell wall biosynthesis